MSEGRFNLSALAVRERSITLFLICLISLAGLVSFFKLGRAEDPAFTVKVMTIITAWPGATAQEMHDQVAEKIEKRMQELRWYDRTETYTRPGLAFTTLTLLDSTPPSEVQEQFYQARKKINDEAANLPAGVIGPMVNDEYADVTFALFALKAKGEPQRLLVRDAETLRQRLLHVPGVKKVNIIGEQGERIYVQFSHDRLATLGVSPQDVFAALNGQNALTPAGSVETKGPEVFIRLDGAFDNLQKIRDTPVVAQGRTLKLSDIATVTRGYEDPATFIIRNNGEPALLLGVVMRDGWNGLDLGKALDNEVGVINAGLPLGMGLTKVTDQSVNISSSVNEFMVKFFAALLVVMLVSFVSMGWRVGLVVAAAVPLTLKQSREQLAQMRELSQRSRDVLRKMQQLAQELVAANKLIHPSKAGEVELLLQQALDRKAGSAAAHQQLRHQNVATGPPPTRPQPFCEEKRVHCPWWYQNVCLRSRSKGNTVKMSCP